jgi:hypothetical protein
MVYLSVVLVLSLILDQKMPKYIGDYNIIYIGNTLKLNIVHFVGLNDTSI